MKKVLSLILVIALAAGIAVTGTMAYLTDRDNETNVFTVGDVDIELSEEYAQGSQLLPGVTITKKPTIENVGKNDAWVWLTYAVPTALEGVVIVDVDDTKWDKGTSFEEEINGVKYTVVPLLYDAALAAGEKTATAAFDSITLSASVDVKPDGAWYTVDATNGPKSLGWNNSNGAPVIYVNAYAIQEDMDGVDDVQDAYANYVGQWGDKLGGEYGDVPEVEEVSTAAELADALADGGIVVLNADVELEAGEKIEIPAGVSATLNLNGNTVSVTQTEAKATSAIDNKGNLTITDGAVTYLSEKPDAAFGYGTNTINNSGTLVIDGATIINTTDGGSSNAIDNAPGSKLVVNSGTIESKKIAIRVRDNADVTINGGEISGSRAVQIHLFQNVKEDTRLTINGGTFTGTELALYSVANGNCTFEKTFVTITGGTFNGDVAFGGGNKTATETVSITGGLFNGELGRYLANDGWEDFVKPATTVNVDTAEELQNALNNAGNGSEVVLDGDIDLNDLFN